MFGKDTIIRIWSGLEMPVQEIEEDIGLVGETYLAYCPECRVVHEVYKDRRQLYRFHLWCGCILDLTEDHILCLKDNKNKKYEITVKEYLSYDQDTRNKYAMYQIYEDILVNIDCILKIEDIGIGDCYGFRLDGNHLFLNKNYVVLHD